MKKNGKQPTKKKSTKKAGKKKSDRKGIEIPEETPSLEIYINAEGLIDGIRSSISLAFRIIDLGLQDEKKMEAPAVAWGYTKDGGEYVIPQYDPKYMEIYGEG